MKKVILGIILSLVTIACSSVANLKLGKMQNNIHGITWIMTGETLKNSEIPTIHIDQDKISGTAGCNTYFGYAIVDKNNGTFSVKNIATTRMACKNTQVEQAFLNMLSQADKYVSDGNTLNIYKGNILLMKFTKKDGDS
ncbi:META domain-containing protein [Riemerella columbipharyngis]|uniref:Heat shock protein HslJ n=1 Tax=Riemerella columbipharyngis TaxID=1071918 RepID=A0A1G7CF18_9FLAO|nr:META domain-containing protein [Riemerella columbipharyngis]SDE37843.1 Heat shock protein HslJ [Riemerella columbipharyngis]